MPHTKLPAKQRAASLVHLAPLLTELGVDLDEVLEGTAVSIADLSPHSPQGRNGLQAYSALFGMAASSPSATTL